jgi:pimeloyl-ACP methyl ester carboxylesterase
MDHLGIDKFMVLGFCIGGPFIWNLLRRAPDRIIASVLAQPSGSRPELRDLFYETNLKGWGPELVKRRPDITMEMVDRFLTRMYRTNADFVFTVTRDFVRHCRTPVLILPDDIPPHPYAVAMEAAMLAPQAEVSIFPWKEPSFCLDGGSHTTGRQGDNAMTQELEIRTVRTVFVRLMPLLMACYLLAYLDRINIGFAAVTMNHDLHLDAYHCGLGAGLFFWGYFFFEVPSNLMLQRFGARRGLHASW